MFRLIHADCVEAMSRMDEASVDAIVTDPPYGLGFMGKEWDSTFVPADVPMRRNGPQDAVNTGAARQGGRQRAGLDYQRRMARDSRDYQSWCETWATQALRVLKPGGHLLAFGGTRTFHRLTCALEDAGFEIRDCLSWLYGSGFPKSLDVSKAIDKAAGAEREQQLVPTKVGNRPEQAGPLALGATGMTDVSAPATPDAQRWQGWGTALKPAYEPVVWATKPVAVSDVLATIGSQLDDLEAAWQAQEAAPPTPTGRVGDSSAPTATSRSGSGVVIASSIVSSWRDNWAALCDLTSTSTTATTSRATTDLRTLSSCLSELTPDIITQATTAPGGARSLVAAVDRLFGAVYGSLSATLALSALGLATANTPHSLRDGAEPAPNWEPVVLARKPLIGTVAANVLEHGTGAINVDGCRVETDGRPARENTVNGYANIGGEPTEGNNRAVGDTSLGRWPANVVLDETAAALLDEQSGERPGFRDQNLYAAQTTGAHATWDMGERRMTQAYNDTGGASRFFYTAKAGREERNRGLMPGERSTHPTVKPVALMQWLCRLVTPPGGIVLDPFTGSGSTGIAALREGFEFIGIEREAEYVEIARDRIVGDAPLFNVEEVSAQQTDP